ncbi:MAG: hypothetical protein K2O01_04275 [Bacteroidales bacterium]|nr:hypothetical protein [Bacteroidales bacterium]
MPWRNESQKQGSSLTRMDLRPLLERVIGFKGQDFPAGWLGVRQDGTSGVPTGGVSLADNGTVLRKKDLLGGYYLLPVSFSSGVRTYEIDCALVSARLRKTIVQTPLSGYGGSVKELVSPDDMEISITGCLLGKRGVWPEERIMGLRELFEENAAVSLKCALTDCFFDMDDKVVLTSLSFPSSQQVEDIVPVRIECVRDQVYELNLR